MPGKDILVTLTTEQVKSLLKLKAERDYLFNTVNICTKSDSVKGKVITDQQKSIDEYSLLNQRMASNLSAAQEELSKQSARKESWRNVALIGIPISFVGGIIFTLLF